MPDLEAWEIAALAILPAIRCSTISSSVPSSILCFPGVKKRRRRVKRAKINRVELGSMGVRNFSTVADGFQIQVQIAAHSLRKKTSVLPRFSSELFGYLVCGPGGMEFAIFLSRLAQ